MRRGVSHNQRDLQPYRARHRTLLFSIHSVCLFLVSPYKYKSSASLHEFPRWKGIFHARCSARQCAPQRLNCKAFRYQCMSYHHIYLNDLCTRLPSIGINTLTLLAHYYVVYCIKFIRFKNFLLTRYFHRW